MTNGSSSKPQVAIACQGGGSYAAFGAGALLHLFSPEQRDRFELVGLSGTSGGALSAALLWRGLVSSGPDEALQRLGGFWHDLSSRHPSDALANLWDVWLARLPMVINVTPYLAEPLAEPLLRTILQRHLDLESLTLDSARRARPKLFVGATDILSGTRVIFEGEGLSYDALMASAAVPPLFRAVRVGRRLCWDGLFTTNPPVREFTGMTAKPDEIWVIQVNPQRRAREPRSMREIKDRSNELSGNLSLGQELYFMTKINQLLRHHDTLLAKYKPIRIRVIDLEADGLDYAAKLDRHSAFFEGLLEAGRQRAEWFFDERSDWPRERTPPAKSVIVNERPAASAWR